MMCGSGIRRGYCLPSEVGWIMTAKLGLMWGPMGSWSSRSFSSGDVSVAEGIPLTCYTIFLLTSLKGLLTITHFVEEEDGIMIWRIVIIGPRLLGNRRICGKSTCGCHWQLISWHWPGHHDLSPLCKLRGWVLWHGKIVADYQWKKKEEIPGSICLRVWARRWLAHSLIVKSAALNKSS